MIIQLKNVNYVNYLLNLFYKYDKILYSKGFFLGVKYNNI